MADFLLSYFTINLYFITLFFGLVIDDIEWREKIKNGIFKRAPWTRFYSGGTISTNTFIDHATTLSLHLLTVLLINHTFHNPFAAALYAIHPCTHQTSIWLNGRRYAILNILILLAYKLKIIIPVLIAIIPIIIIYFIHRNAPRRQLYKIVRPPITHIIVIFKSLGFNIIKLVGATPIASLYPFLENQSLKQLGQLDIYALIGISVFITLLPFHPWILLSLLLASSTIPYTQTCADRYLSLPLIFISLIIPNIYIIILMPILTFRTISLLPMYINIDSFYSYHQQLFPQLKKLLLLKNLYHKTE
jgi:hypothetical protein